jgi:hypothetical protein
MTARTLVSTFAIAAWISVAPSAHATHANPGAKAKKVIADLVVAYEPCTAPDTVTDGSAFPACATPVRSDPLCGFGANGKGQLKIKASGTRLRIGFKLTGLDVPCEGEIMGVVFRWRVTGHQCGGAACTVDETTYMPGYGGCTVTGGVCVLTSTGDLPALSSGGQTGVEFIGADIVRAGTITTFRTGFFWQ